MILIQLLERLNPSTAAALSLCRIDDLPGLIVALLYAVAGFTEIEDHPNQD